MPILRIVIREAPGGPNQDIIHTSTSTILSISLSIGLSFIVILGLCWRRRVRNRRLAAQRPEPLANIPLQDVPRRKVLARNLLQSIPVIIWRVPRGPDEGGGNVSVNDDGTGTKQSRASTEGEVVDRTPEELSEAPIKDLTIPVTVIESIPTILNGGTEESEGLSGSRLASRSCSICTEDFVDGSAVRILPCLHVYHTRCIDPWLLDFAGTCPICRTDFQNLEPPQDEPVEAPEPAVLSGETLLSPHLRPYLYLQPRPTLKPYFNLRLCTFPHSYTHRYQTPILLHRLILYHPKDDAIL